MKPIKTMIREISDIAVEAGLVNADWPAKLQVKIRKGDGGAWGGMKYCRPWINVCAAHDWSYKPDANTDAYIRQWTVAARKGPKRTRVINRLAKVKSGLAVWGEYASIAKDPEIGDLVGDPNDKAAPEAVVLCHEIAHAIDYTAGEQEIAGRKYGAGGTGHKGKWQAIYRVLRNAYVASGAYLEVDKPVLGVITGGKPLEARMELIGLPLFEAAA
jgi:hypothetical protein